MPWKKGSGELLIADAENTRLTYHKVRASGVLSRSWFLMTLIAP